MPITSDIPLAYTDQTLDIQPNKIHVRGVDDATTNDIRDFAKEHFTLADPVRIEWIDDTSANILYSTNEFASKALEALSRNPSDPAISANPLDLRSAKPMPSRPDSNVQIRPALFTDKKRPRAHEASRFYLMHPEHDPRERMRIERRRGGRAGGDDNGDYNRRRYDDREHRRRRDQDATEGDSSTNFDASMYDDAAEPTNGSETAGRGRDLFSRVSRQRARSASPTGFHSSDSDPDTSRSRRYRSRRSPPRRNNASKELFPSNSSSTLATPSSTNGTSLLQRERDAPPQPTTHIREVFPAALPANKSIASSLKKELFPHKTPISNHRRTDAVDAAADETANLFTRKLSVGEERELFPDKTDNEAGLSIRGSAGMQVKGSAGITIKGRGAGRTGAGEVKELFPVAYAEPAKKNVKNQHQNQGKELFSDILEGRGGRRRRAEDLFE